MDLVDLVEVGGVFLTAQKARSRDASGLVLDLLSLFAAPWRMLKLSSSRWQLFESVDGRRSAALRLAPLYLAAAGLRLFTDSIVSGRELSMLTAMLFIGLLALMSRIIWDISARLMIIYMAVSVCSDLAKSLASVASTHLWVGFGQILGIFPTWEVLATITAFLCMSARKARTDQPASNHP